MITDENADEVVRISREIDSILFQYMEQNENLHPLHLFSIVLARMAAITHMSGASSSYKRLLQEVLKIIEMRETANTEYGNYH